MICLVQKGGRGGVFFRRVLPSAISNACDVGAGFVTWMISIKLGDVLFTQGCFSTKLQQKTRASLRMYWKVY